MKRPAQGEEADGRQRVLIRAERQPVGGKLLQNELVVRQVLIEGPDDVIAIGVGPGEVRLLKEHVPLGVRVAGDIEPVAAPAFAVVG